MKEQIAWDLGFWGMVPDEFLGDLIIFHESRKGATEAGATDKWISKKLQEKYIFQQKAWEHFGITYPSCQTL